MSSIHKVFCESILTKNIPIEILNPIVPSNTHQNIQVRQQRLHNMSNPILALNTQPPKSKVDQ
ncbi:hypothetical protein N7453_006282 [Penicillium expansum]|nr:hypothetical protein N7453_006282 [Penicillium expansum]